MFKQEASTEQGDAVAARIRLLVEIIEVDSGGRTRPTFARRFEHRVAVGSVTALARAVDAKDPTTQRHSERVADLAERLAVELGWRPEAARALREAGLVHDVGKIGLPDAILFKSGPLTRHERRQVEAHSELGAQMVSGILSDEQAAWVRGHHERVDGSGYPQGLCGDEIPEGARILALADAWDAMTSDRAYQAAVSLEAALQRCCDGAGAQFWSPAVEALERLVRACELVAGPSPDAAAAA